MRRRRVEPWRRPRRSHDATARVQSLLVGNRLGGRGVRGVARLEVTDRCAAERAGSAATAAAPARVDLLTVLGTIASRRFTCDLSRYVGTGHPGWWWWRSPARWEFLARHGARAPQHHAVGHCGFSYRRRGGPCDP